jgi:hypothetical protein
MPSVVYDGSLPEWAKCIFGNTLCSAIHFVNEALLEKMKPSRMVRKNALVAPETFCGCLPGEIAPIRLLLNNAQEIMAN